MSERENDYIPEADGVII